jgi:hypothetical protein
LKTKQIYIGRNFEGEDLKEKGKAIHVTGREGP